MMKFVLALSMLAATASATTTTNFAAKRSATLAGASHAGKLEIKFTNGAQIPNGDTAGIVFTAKKAAAAYDLFTAGNDKDISAGVTLKNAAGATIALTSVTLKADKSIVIVPTAICPVTNGGYTLEFPANNLAANPAFDAATAANNDIKFDFKVAPDAALTAQTGYTIIAPLTAVTPVSATRSLSLAPSATNTQAGDLVVKFTTSATGAIATGATATGTIEITSSAAVFGAKPACTLAVAGVTAAPTGVSVMSLTNTKVTITLAAGPANGIAASKDVTVTCTAATSEANPAKGTVFTFDITTTGDKKKTGWTGYTIGSPTTAAASTTSVNMMTIVALAAVALRQ